MAWRATRRGRTKSYQPRPPRSHGTRGKCGDAMRHSRREPMMQPGRPSSPPLGVPMRISALFVLAFALAACAAPGGSTDPTPEASSVEPTPRASLTPSSIQPSPSPEEGGGEELTGVLGADSVEGGCAYLQAPDRTRYEVLYPDGWELSLSPLQLTSPGRGRGPGRRRGHGPWRAGRRQGIHLPARADSPGHRSRALIRSDEGADCTNRHAPDAGRVCVRRDR